MPWELPLLGPSSPIRKRRRPQRRRPSKWGHDNDFTVTQTFPGRRHHHHHHATRNRNAPHLLQWWPNNNDDNVVSESVFSPRESSALMTVLMFYRPAGLGSVPSSPSPLFARSRNTTARWSHFACLRSSTSLTLADKNIIGKKGMGMAEL